MDDNTFETEHAGAGFRHVWVGFPRVRAQLLKLQRPRAEMFLLVMEEESRAWTADAVIVVIIGSDIGDISDISREGNTLSDDENR